MAFPKAMGEGCLLAQENEYCFDLQLTYILGGPFSTLKQKYGQRFESLEHGKKCGSCGLHRSHRPEEYTSLLHESAVEGKVAQSLLQHECGFSFSARATPLGKVKV